MTNHQNEKAHTLQNHWFGNVPSHWQIYRLATLYREVDREAETDLPVLSVSIHGGVSDKQLADDERDRIGNLSEDRTKYQRVKKGDLVYNMMRAWQGAFGSVNVDGLVSPAYVVAEPKSNISTRYIELMLRTSNGVEEARRFSKGIADFRMRLYWDQFRNIRICIPPPDEIEKILGFIDRETGRIDKLIDKKKKFLDLTQERLASLVDIAISDKSLERVRFGNLTHRVERPVSLSESSQLVRLGLLNRGRGVFHKPAADEEDMGDSTFYFVEEGDLIISGQFAWEGAVAIATKSEHGCVVSHRYPVYRANENIITEYILAFLRSDLGNFLLSDASRGSAGRNRPLNTARFEKEKIPVASTELQNSIAKAVLYERRVRFMVDHSIALLNEKKAAIIAAAVTGKIDLIGSSTSDLEVAA